jgi:hypothetical protein
VAGEVARRVGRPSGAFRRGVRGIAFLMARAVLEDRQRGHCGQRAYDKLSLQVGRRTCESRGEGTPDSVAWSARVLIWVRANPSMLMRRIGPHPCRAALSPCFPPPAAYQQRPAQRHKQLDTVMAVQRGREAGTPNDHRSGPGCNTPDRTRHHQRILTSRCRSRNDVANSFKTRASVARYDETALVASSRSRASFHAPPVAAD